MHDINKIFPRPVKVFLFEKGRPLNGGLEEIRQEYHEVLGNPVMVNTKHKSIEETTEYITNQIIQIWKEWNQYE